MKHFNPTDKQILGAIGYVLIYAVFFTFTVFSMIALFFLGAYNGLYNIINNAVNSDSVDIRIINSIMFFVALAAVLLMPLWFVFTTAFVWGAWVVIDYTTDLMIGVR